MISDGVSRRTVGGIALTLLAVAISVPSGPELPAEVVTNWNAAGEPDGYLSKTALVVGGPALVAGTVLLFELFPSIDPLGMNFEEFRAAYEAAALLIAGFMVYVFALVVAWNLGVEFDIIAGLTPAIAVLYIGVGFVLDRAKRNWFVGIRTPWTLSSEQVWDRTHEVGGTLFKVAGVLVFGGLLLPDLTVYFIVAPVAGVALLTTVYSFVLYRRLDSGDVADAAQN